MIVEATQALLLPSSPHFSPCSLVLSFVPFMSSSVASKSTLALSPPAYLQVPPPVHFPFLPLLLCWTGQTRRSSTKVHEGATGVALRSETVANSGGAQHSVPIRDSRELLSFCHTKCVKFARRRRGITVGRWP